MKNIRKIISVIISSFLLVSLIACSDSSKNQIVATGGASGTYYGFTGAISSALNASLQGKLNLNPIATGASKANIQLLDTKEAHIAIVQNDVMSYAYNATDMFEGNAPINSFSAIASCYPESIQIIASKNINSIEDLKGKKVSVGDAGSGTEFNAKQILSIYGIDIDKDINKQNQSFGDSAESLKNGNIDAAFVTAGHPTVAVVELSTNFDFNILSLDSNHINQLVAKYAYYTPLTIPKDTYRVLKNDVQTVAVMATFIARNDLSEDVVYEFTKGLFEQKNSFAHQKAELLNPQTGISGISIPFHAGAMKYYKEIGIKN